MASSLVCLEKEALVEAWLKRGAANLVSRSATKPATTNVMSTPDYKPPPPLIWWAIWAAIMAGLVVIYVALPSPQARPLPENLRYLPIVPWAASAMIRWLVLPRFPGGRAFPIFVIGIALAEGSGILGILLVPNMRAEYLTLALLGLAQYVPALVLRREK